MKTSSSAELLLANLKKILHETVGDNLTCHFSTRISEDFWLFQKLGTFEHPEQVVGPLLHSTQTKRMKFFPDPPNKPLDVKYLSPVNSIDTFSNRNLYGESFVTREKIGACFKCSIHDGQHLAVVIYVNFLEARVGEIDQEALKDVIQRNLQPYVMLYILEASQTTIHEDDAMMLRNISAKVVDDFGAQYVSDRESWKEGIWKPLEKQIRSLAHLGAGDVCQIYMMGRSGRLDRVVGTKNPKSRQDGVSEYVARAGQPYYISEIANYQERLVNGGAGDPRVMPKYLPCCEGMKSELAIPLMLGDKVLGVLNLESADNDHFERLIAPIYYVTKVIAVFMREYITWSDTGILHSFFFSLMDADSDESVLEKLQKTAKFFGTVASVWDADKNKLFTSDGIIRGNVRDDGGFSRWIELSKKPVLLADCHYGDNGKIEYQCHVADISDQKRLVFRLAVSDDALPLKLSDQVGDSLDSDPKVLCDFGVPVTDSNRRVVYGVLWVKLKRFYSTILQEEFWLIFELANSAGRLIEKIRDNDRPFQEVFAKKILDFHFGAERAGLMVDERRNYGDLLKAREIESTIVFKGKISGLNHLISSAAEAAQNEIVTDLLKQYHRESRRLIIKGGVFDSMDVENVSGIYNIYHAKGIEVAEIFSQSASIEAAVFAALGIAENLSGALRAISKSGMPVNKGTRFSCVIWLRGAGSMVGSLDNHESGYFDFTVYGKIRDTALNLLEYANTEEVYSMLDKNGFKFYSVAEIPEKNEEGQQLLDEAGIARIKAYLDTPNAPIILCSHEFLDLKIEGVERIFIEDTQDGVGSDPVLGPHNRAVLILPKDLSAYTAGVG